MNELVRIATAALDSLLRVEEGRYADRALNDSGRRFRLNGESRLEVKRWLFRTLRWRDRFDAALAQSGDNWRDPVTRSAGRLALSAGFEGEGRPDLIQALVESLGQQGKRKAGILLTKLAPSSVKQMPLSKVNADAATLSELFSHPLWIVELLLTQLGEDAIPLLEANNQEPPATLRVNTLRVSRDELIRALAEEGIECAPCSYSPLGLQVQGTADVFRTEAYRNGLFEMQDEGSQLIGYVLDPKPRGLVIDACAGGGGKSLLLACLLRNRARVLSLDIYENKLARLRERARRAGVSNLETRLVRPGGLETELVSAADAVLIDAPCSGLGALRRNPDAKWRLTPSAIDELTTRQLGLLHYWGDGVKPGGLLTYATCTVLRQENEDIVHDFLKSRPDFVLERADERLPIDGERFLTEEGFFRCWPHRDSTDGFFAARLRRQSA